MGENIVVWVLAVVEVAAIGAVISLVHRQFRDRRR
jgi:hypothetical protein